MQDYVRVAKLEHYFWNNNSYTYPTSIPSESNYDLIRNVQPYLAGINTYICVLTGDYNSAIYEGKYYKLIKLETIDFDKKIFKYQFEHDVMLNFLKFGGSVKGTLIKTNDLRILEKHLQTTKPILDNPTEIYLAKFERKELTKDSWRQDCQILYPNKLFKDVSPTVEGWGKFLSDLENNLIYRNLKNNKLAEFKNNLYILEHFSGSQSDSWKNNVISMIKEQFADLSGKTIGNADTVSNYFSQFKAVTPKVGGCASTEDTQTKIFKIDLSTVYDIEVCNVNDGNFDPSVSVKPLFKDYLGVQPVLGAPTLLNIRKLSRKPHLPLKSGHSTNLPREAFLPVNSKHYEYLDNYEDTGYVGNEPQKVTFKPNTTTQRVGYLWQLNHLDFALISGKSQFGDNSAFSKRSMPDIEYHNSDEYIFQYLERRLLPGIGFLIFDYIKKWNEWENDFEYKGISEIQYLKYRSGISTNLVTIYKDPLNLRGEKAWWAHLPDDGAIRFINGTTELSYLTLDIDLLSWLYFAPCYSGSNWWYQYRYNNDWGYRRFLVNYSETSGTIYYTPYAVKSDLGWRTRQGEYAVVQKNPYSPERIELWLTERDKKINDISLIDTVELPYRIKQGDIFASDVTWRWTNNLPIISEVPFAYRTSAEYTKDIFSWISTIALIVGVGATVYLFPPSAGVIGLKGLVTGTLVGAAGGAVGSSIYHSYQIPIDITTRQGKTALLNASVLGDLFSGTEADTSDYVNKIVVYYLNRKLRYGIYREYKKTLKLSDDPQQIVEDVEGSNTRQVTYYHIQNLDNNEIDPKTGLSDVQKQAILTEAYKLNNPNIYDYNKTTLSKGTHLFRLKGTPWYAYFKNGLISLISTDPQLFTKFESIKFKPKFKKSVDDITTYEKINQTANLIAYGTTRRLNYRFTFQPEIDNFEIKETDIQVDNKPSSLDYILLEGGNDHDKFDEWISVTKPGLIASDTVSGTDIATLNLALQHSNQSYHIDKWQHDLATKSQLRQFAFDRTDADWNLAQNIVDTINAAVSTAILFRTPKILGGKEALSTDVSKLATATRFTSFNKQGKPVKNKFSTLQRLKNKTMAARHGMFTGKYRASIVGAGFTSASGLVNSIKHSTIVSRINEEEEMFTNENALTELERDVQYIQDREQLLNSINAISSAYIKTEMNDRDVFTKYITERDLGNVYLQILLPSKLQKEKIINYIDNYGCECLVEYYEEPFEFYNHMDPIMVQFTNLDFESVNRYKTYLNEEEYIALQNIFQEGVRFVKHNHNFLKPMHVVIYTPQDEPVGFDLDNIDKWDRTTWDHFVYTNNPTKIKEILKSKPHYGLTKEEYEKFKDQINEDTLYEDLNKIFSDRNTGELKVIRVETPDPDKEFLQQKLKELEDCKKQLEDLKLEHETLTEQKTDVEEQLRQCKIDHKNVLQAKDFCDLTNAKKIKEQEAIIKNLEAEIKTKEALLAANQEKIKVTQAEVDKNVEDLKKQIAILENDKKTLEDDKRGLQTQSENYKKLWNSELTAKENTQKELDKCKKDSEEHEQKIKEAIIATEKAFQERTNNLNKQIEGLKKQKTDIENKLHEAVEKSKKESAEAFNKQIENLENQKADIERQLREKIDSTNTTIRNKDNEIAGLKEQLSDAWTAAKQGCPSYRIDLCSLFRELSVSANYNMDIKIRENGFSAFTDLCFELAENISWIRKSDIQRRIQKYPGMPKIFELLNELEQIPTIDKCEDAVNEEGWPKFVEWLNKGGDKNGSVDKIIALTNTIKSDLCNPRNVHAVKLVMDELNFLSNKAMTDLAEQMKEDEDLEHFFKHFYPGQNTKRLYETLYGVKAELATAQRKYLDTTCVVGGGGDDPITFLDKKIKETKFKVPAATTTDKTPSTLPMYQCHVLDGERITFYWFPKVFYSTPGSCGGKVKDESLALIRYCYKKGTYWRGERYYHWVGALMWEASSTDRGSGNTPLASQSEKGMTIGRYDGWFDAIGNVQDRELYIRNPFYSFNENKRITPEKTFNIINELWKKKDEIVVPDDVLALIKSGNLILYPYIKNESLTYKCQSLNYSRELNVTKTFGKENAADVWRLLYILHYNCHYFDNIGTYDSLSAWNTNFRRQSHPSSIVKEKTLKIQNWFADFHSLLNFIYRYVVLKKPITNLSDWQSPGYTRENKSMELVSTDWYV